jgi:dihydrofolate reductase
VHRFVNELERPVGTYLYGRRMYETMAYWEKGAAEPDYVRDFTDIWRAADKVVYSRTLKAPSTARTRIEREFDPGAVRRMKNEATAEITIGGPHLAAQAIEAGLVDELHIFVVPVLVGAGNSALPVRTFSELVLSEERRFGGGTVFLRYRFDR